MSLPRVARRDFLTNALAGGIAACTGTVGLQAAANDDKPLGIVIHSYGIRARVEREKSFPDPLNFLEFCQTRQASSVQLSLGTRDAAYCQRLRSRCETLAMGLEAIVRAPQDASDVSRFEAEVRTAREAGATVARTVMLSGRRYEVFRRLDEYRAFEQRSRATLELARPIVERHALQLAVENHKDYRAGDLASLLKHLNCDYIGACIDTGNNIALLEDPLETAKTLAPWAMACHFKDMGVREYTEGFLLSEVPLGQGFLDLKQIVRVLRAARPQLRFHLEMMTREPLRVPCLTPEYWATLPNLPAQDLAAALARIRRDAQMGELPRIAQLSEADQVALEDRNVIACMNFARSSLA